MQRTFGYTVSLALIMLLIGSLGVSPFARVNAEEASSSSDIGSNGKYRYEFLVLGMSCANCAKSAESVLRDSISEIMSIEVNFDSKKAIIESKSPLEESEIRDALGALGFETKFSGEQPPPKPLTDAQRAELDIETISKGEKIAIQLHLAPGKLTIFDYYANWCGPCHLLSPRLERLVKERGDVALRVIDISNWESQAAKQATEDFQMPALPYVRLYGRDGQFLGDVVGNHYDKIITIIKDEKQ